MEQSNSNLKPDVTPMTYQVKKISYFEWASAMAQYLKDRAK